MDVTRRIGIYGGTFNPIHIAHLALAEEIRERLDLEQVLFVPSNLPPHKGSHLPTGAERLALVRLAIRGNPSFGAIDLEVVPIAGGLRKAFPISTTPFPDGNGAGLPDRHGRLRGDRHLA